MQKIHFICLVCLPFFLALPARAEVTEPPGVTEQKILVQQEISSWVQAHFTEYYQKYYLSCEAAVVRMVSAAFGITLSEDEILEIFPYHKSDPGLGLVIESINGRTHYADGSINWSNYGAHAEVVLGVLETIFRDNGLLENYSLEIIQVSDPELRELFKTEQNCLGAIIWVAAYINKKKPPVNDIGQVLGEHVQYVAPVLDAKGRMLVYDVWPWPKQPFKLYRCLNRDLFDNKVIILRSIVKTEAGE